MPKIDIRPDAKDDIALIFNRIAAANLEAALRVVDAIESATELLAKNPLAGASCESEIPGTEDCRFWPLKNYTDYLIIYRPTADGIEVLRVFHGAYDLQRVLRRL